MSVLKDIRRIYAGLNADEIRGAAYRDLNVGLMASGEECYSEMEQFFAPAWIGGSAQLEALKAIHRVDGSPRSRFDFVLCESGIPLPSNGYTFYPADKEYLARAIVADHQELELAIGRRFPQCNRQ